MLCGRCDAGKALVESPLYPGLFVISAPYSGGQVAAGALQSFLQQAGGVFDDIVLDTAAGMGAPFEAARAAASLALIWHHARPCGPARWAHCVRRAAGGRL